MWLRIISNAGLQYQQHSALSLLPCRFSDSSPSPEWCIHTLKLKLRQLYDKSNVIIISSGFIFLLYYTILHTCSAELSSLQLICLATLVFELTLELLNISQLIDSYMWEELYKYLTYVCQTIFSLTLQISSEKLIKIVNVTGWNIPGEVMSYSLHLPDIQSKVARVLNDTALRMVLQFCNTSAVKCNKGNK